MSTFSKEHIKYLKKIKREKRIVFCFQLLIMILFFVLWELFARFNIINTFLTSSPSNMIRTIMSLLNDGILFHHIWVTTYETIISFVLAMIIGLVVATILWWNKLLAKIMDPYLVMLNSLPKVALGPLIIIWVGASVSSIIVMALFISTFIVIISIYNGFAATNKHYITLLKTFKANKRQLFFKVILPSNYLTIINSLKLNISMSLIGVVMGELLVSRSGLGFLIMHGSQVFNINLIITSVFLLGILSYIMFCFISSLEKYVIKKH